MNYTIELEVEGRTVTDEQLAAIGFPRNEVIDKVLETVARRVYFEK